MKGRLLEQWPNGPDGKPERAALLEWLPDYPAFGGLALAQLEAFGIPVFAERPGSAEATFLYLGTSSGLRLYVPASRLAEAQAILSPETGSPDGADPAVEADPPGPSGK